MFLCLSLLLWALSTPQETCALASNASSPFSSISSYIFTIGITNISMTKEVFAERDVNNADLNLPLAFLNLHENENTSVISARSYLVMYGGSLVKFSNGHKRYISFQLEPHGAVYTADPNRIFTAEGIVATLQANGPYCEEAAVATQKLADQILSLYEFDNQDTVLALHNNGGSYGANSYLPGGPYEQDASAVNIVPGSNPSDFFYVVEDYYYNQLASAGYNVVLQDNENVTNDGSLSYYSGLKGKSYINFESQAEYTSFGQQVVIELDMILGARSAILANAVARAV